MADLTPEQTKDALLAVAAYIRGGLQRRDVETARAMRIEDPEEMRRVASAALDFATVMLRNYAAALNIDPIEHLDALVKALLETDLDA